MRIYKGLRNIPGAIELQRVASSIQNPSPVKVADCSGNVVQDIAALMLHAGRPELLATDIVAILAGTDAVHYAAATARNADGALETLDSCGRVGEASRCTTVPLGTARGRAIEVVIHPRDDIESTATVNALTLLLGTVRDLERAQAEREEQLALWPIEELPIDGDKAVVGGCLHELLSNARRVARTNVSILITGESGTGKEILARAIHGYSPRADKPFVPFNCTAVPREMLESQLFGYRRGAFTGAERDHPGLIRTARGGSLFLDEIGELSIDLQPKLLRFLESGEISPLGESPSTVDVRIIAATNRHLDQLVEDGRFREDLYYRLNVIRLTIPPLRERRDEIPPLVHHFLLRTCAEFAKPQVRIAEETMEHLLLYQWPGNIRQLHNEIRRIVALAEPNAVLKPAILSPEIRRAAAAPAAREAGPELAISLGDKLNPTITRIEREMIRAALRTHRGRVEAAAKALGISRKGLYLKRQRLGL
jgi:transcriptional regulator with PAS, ATPase and Fis domain